MLGLAVLPAATACTSRSLAESASVSAGSPEVAKVLELDIAHETMRCTQTSDEQCLQIRRDPNGPWELCYDKIDGFDFDQGYRSHLRVQQTPAENPRSEAASLRLLEVLDKQRVIPDAAQRPDYTGLDGPGPGSEGFLPGR